MHYGIVLLFDTETNERAIALSEEYRRAGEDPDFVLGRERNLPHLSLLHLELETAAVVEMAAALREVRKALLYRPLTGAFSSVRGFATWCWWLTPATPELLALHERAVDLCAPLRSGPLIERPERMTEAQERMYETYGCWFVKDAWNPHLTLQVVRPIHAGLCGGEVFQPWKAVSIALARMGKFGSVQEVIHRSSL